jgi:AraC-like DNA-binding protein
MMLALIAARLGPDLAAKVSDQFILERIRRAGDPQTLPFRTRAALSHPALGRAVALMRETVEAPLAMAAIAARLGLSRRQLERLFQAQFRQSPAEFYAALRLDRARELLRLTGMPVGEIGLACGFPSASHFSTAYGRHFGHAPRQERAWGRHLSKEIPDAERGKGRGHRRRGRRRQHALSSDQEGLVRCRAGRAQGADLGLDLACGGAPAALQPELLGGADP